VQELHSSIGLPKAMAAALGNDAVGDLLQKPTTPKGDSEAAMLMLLQKHMTTILRPFVDHVDQLFKAVESLSSDLANEQARSRGQHEEISLRLSDLVTEQARSRGQHEEMSLRLGDIDRTVTMHLMKVTSTVEEHRDCEVVQAQLDQWLAEVLEPMLQQQSDHQANRLSNLDAQMQALLTLSLQPALEQHMEMIKGQLDSFSSRLSVAEADAETTASSLQDHKILIGACQKEIVAACAQTEGKLGVALDSALKKVYEEKRLEFSGLDGRFSAAAAEAAGCTSHLRKEFQQAMDTMQQNISGTQKTWGMKVADVQSITSALQLGLQQQTDAVQEIAVRLTETNSIIADKLEPAIEEQQRRMSELNDSEQDKLSRIEGKIEKLSRALEDVASGLAATNGRLAENLEACRLKKNNNELATSAKVANGVQREVSADIQLECRLQQGRRLTSDRIVIGPPKGDLTPRSVEASWNTSKPIAAKGNSVEAICKASLTSIPGQALPSRALIITKFPDNPVAGSLPHEEMGHQ